MKQLVVLLILIFPSLHINAQKISLKEKALEEFKKEHYNEAITLLELAVEQYPEDAEIYYYLGFFNHYRAYDSRPLNGYNFSYSEKIFQYLDKAIELDPNYGNAKYFYGAECSGNAFVAMQNYDLEQLKHFYQLAYEKGAYPDWLVELGKNILRSCDKDAILFTGGNADLDICSYLQLHQNFRTDITVIPIANIDRPWYVKFLKQGLEGGIRNISLNLKEDQIYDMHPFKWDTTLISIPISKEKYARYNLAPDYKMEWKVVPDLLSERQHSKIEGEKTKKRTYLSPQRAILLQIIEDNFKDRPIYFSNTANPFFYGGLDDYFQNCGLVSELTPLELEHSPLKNNYEKIEELLQAKNFKDFSTIINSDIPRISGIIFLYHGSLLVLAEHYNEVDKEKLAKLKELYSEYLAIGFHKNEQFYQKELNKMEIYHK